MIRHVINLTLSSTATVLFSDPKDRIVEVNEWAQFDCTVRCGYTVGWYMAGYRNAIRQNNTVPGLLIKRPRVTRCSGSNQKTTHSIKVFATEPFNKSTFYCAAYETRTQENSCSCGTGGRCYSRPALLTGENFWNVIFFLRFPNSLLSTKPTSSNYYCLPAVIMIDMTLK